MYFTYEADYHCRKHTIARFGKEAVQTAITISQQHDDYSIVMDSKLFNAYPKDNEGNILHIETEGRIPYCSECVYEQVAARSQESVSYLENNPI